MFSIATRKSRPRAVLLFTALASFFAGGAWLVTAAAPTAGEEPFRVEYALPSDPIFHLTVDGRAVRDGWDQLALAKLMQEEQMQAFIEPIMAQMDEMVNEAVSEVESAVGLSSDELQELVAGNMTLTLSSFDMGDGSGPPAIDLVMTFDLEENPALLGKVAGIIEKTMRDEMRAEPRRGELAGVPVWSSNLEGIDLVWGTVGRHLVAGTNTATMADVLGRLKAETPSGGLFATEQTRAALAKVSPSGTPVAFVYADVPRLKALLLDSPVAQEMPLEPFFALLGIDAMRSASYACSFEGKAVVDRFWVSAPSGLSGIYADVKSSDQPLRTLAMAPRSSLLYEGFRFDFRSAADRVVAASHDVDDDLAAEIEEFLAGFEEQFGFTLIEDFLGSFGHEMAFWVGGSPYGGMFPELVAALELKDAASFTTRLDSMLAAIEQKGAVRRFRFLDHDFRYLDTARMQGSAPAEVSIKPTLVIADGFCLIALAPQTLKNFVASRAAQQREGLDGNADMKAGLAHLRGKNPIAGNAGLLYVDLGGAATRMIDTLVPVAQSMDMPPEVPVDMALFPTSDIFRKHLFGITGAGSVGKDGLASEIYSPMGYMTMVAGFAAMGAVAWSMDSEMHAEPDPGWEEWEGEDWGEDMPQPDPDALPGEDEMDEFGDDEDR